MRKLKCVLKASKKKTKICKVCLKTLQDSDFMNIFNSKNCLCDCCLKKFNPVFKFFYLKNIKIHYIYYYDEFIKELLYQFKGCYDFELKTVFFDRFAWFYYLKFFNYYKVYAPSYYLDDETRGFNHVKEIFSSLHLKEINCFKKNYPTRQVDVSKNQRENISELISIENGERIYNKKILILDDVYTTGSTVKSMINLLKAYHPKKIEVLVMSRTMTKVK